jgi:tetratricopeptide (TPR) repeat protein
LHGKNCCGTAENNHEALAEAPVLPVRIPVGERHNGSNHNRRSPKSNLQGLPSIDHDFSRPVAQHGLSPWSSSHLAPRGLSPWTDQTSFLSQDNVRIFRQNAQPRTSEPREALKDATKRLPRSAHILQRRTEGITHTVKKVVDAPQHQYILSGTDDDAARRDLNSRGEPNATSPRWGRVFTSQRSLFEPCIRTQQLSASASTPRRRGLTSKICKEDPRRRAAPHAEVETPEQVSQREAIPKNPQVPPIVREGQSFHFSPQSYCDLVRRHNVSVRYTPGSNCNSIPRIPDSQALKRIRYKKLAAASGKGPLARGLKHSVQNRSDTKPHTPAAMNEDDYVRKLETDPNDLHVLACYADLLARKNRLVEAENTYRRALALPVHGRSDDYAEILYAYAMFLWTTDRCMKAEKYFELGLKYNSAHFDLLCNYGLAMFARGAYAAAKERFFRASILRPGDVRSKLGYAICLEYIGKSPCEDIAKVYDGIFALDPDYPEAVFSCARFWKTHDKRELAWKYYRKALALKPYDAAWLCSYGNFLSEEASSAFLKRTHEAGCHWRALFAQAEAVFLTALRLAPRDAIVMHAFAGMMLLPTCKVYKNCYPLRSRTDVPVHVLNCLQSL